MKTPIYLDYNATTPIDPEVVSVMTTYLTTHFGNPSSEHIFGMNARRGVERAREQLAQLIGAAPQEIIFTGCATEANNLALLGLAGAAPTDRRHIVMSAIEHPSVAQPCRRLQQQGWEISVASVDGHGLVNPDAVARLLREDTALVTIMHANNEIGTIQPIGDIAAITREKHIPLHVDAAQSVGKIIVDVGKLGVDTLSIAGHKFYAPKGVGALYARSGTRLLPLMYGADHELGTRPGTENVAGIAGLGEAARLAWERLPDSTEQLRKMRDYLHARLRSAIPGLMLNGHLIDRLPNTLNASFPGVSGHELLAHASGDVAASVGSACHSGDDAPSGVLAALGLEAERSMGAVRLSIGLTTTTSEIDHATAALATAWRALTSEGRHYRVSRAGQAGRQVGK